MVLAFVSGAGGVGPAALLWDPCALWVWPVHQTPQARGHRRLRGGSSLRKGRSGLGLGRLRSLRRVSCSPEARRGGRAHLCWGHSRSCKGTWPSPKVLTSRCPPGHAGFLFVAGGGGGEESHRACRGLCRSIRGPTAGVRAGPLPGHHLRAQGGDPALPAGSPAEGGRAVEGGVVTARDGAVPRASQTPP